MTWLILVILPSYTSARSKTDINTARSIGSVYHLRVYYMAQLCMPSGPNSLYSLRVKKPLLTP